MKTKIIFLTLLISLFYACEVSNTSDVEINTLDLVGTWSLTNIVIDDAVINITSPVVLTVTGNGFGKDLNASLTFSENPNLAVINGDFTFVLNYNSSGETHTEELYLDDIFFNDTFGFLSSSWQLDGNTLTLNEGGEQLNIDIISFIDEVLTIEVDVNKTITVDDVTSIVTGKATLTIEK
ncbi:lipocalin family protein [Polaribacter vadi]|uniref:lipocalin family protein n=1 Tax=Polaribacter TaxID=52959 RepID=UPI001C0863B7|nr:MULTISPECIES: lipocalin family protein [Polaribacter]MBU3011798.1 lipocalin family protein [Polaribacter vadi]MDO6741611.1 lipocalin family protein [Polaribacter sp. 1_MG-2023]